MGKREKMAECAEYFTGEIHLFREFVPLSHPLHQNEKKKTISKVFKFNLNFPVSFYRIDLNPAGIIWSNTPNGSIN